MEQNLMYAMNLLNSQNIPHSTLQNQSTIWEDRSIKLFYSDYLKKKENLVIVDIGAQVGLYTLYAKKLTNATFYAYEPYDVEFDILQKI